jgi:hypothetical protein
MIRTAILAVAALVALSLNAEAMRKHPVKTAYQSLSAQAA